MATEERMRVEWTGTHWEIMCLCGVHLTFLPGKMGEVPVKCEECGRKYRMAKATTTIFVSERDLKKGDACA